MSQRRGKKAHALPEPLPPEGFARLDQVLGAFPVSKATWYRGIAEGRYPRPHKLGPRSNGWDVDQIRALITSTLEKTE
jgi:prophage regulatory protein